MTMRSVVAFGLLAFIAHAEVQEKAPDLIAHLMNMSESESQEFAGKFVDKLVNKLYDQTGMQQLATSALSNLATSDSTNGLTYKFDDKLINELFAGQFGAQSTSMAIPTRDERYPNSYVLGDNDAANYAYDRLNSDIDPTLASAAKVAVAIMNQGHEENQALPGLETPTRDARYPNSYTIGNDEAANYAYDRYNSDIDPKMALAAKAAVSQMRQLRAPEEQELAENSTTSMNMAPMALMVFFVGGVLTFATRHFGSNRATGNKEALMAGYTPIHA